MKVLLIHTSYKQKGGEDAVVANEEELLRANGAEVEVLRFSNHQQTLLKILQLPFNIAAYNQTVSKLKAFKPDVVHVHNTHFSASPSIFYAAKKFNVPVVVTLHNYRLLCPSATLFHKGSIYMPSVGQIFPYQAVLKGVYLNSRLLTAWLGISMFAHYIAGTWNIPARYIVLGNHSRKLFSLSKYNALVKRMVVKPNFCYETENTGLKENFYLYVGRLSQEKGLNVLLEAFTQTTLILKIAGDGPLRDMVAHYCRQYPNIQYIGVVNKTEVSELLCKAEALIFPSVWYETFGMVIIEAFAAGTPVIASALGNIKELVTDHINGLHFEPGNAANLYRKLMYYDTLTVDKKEIYRQNAKQTYEQHYTPQINARRLFSVYKDLLPAGNISELRDAVPVGALSVES